jgi:hypothetical protein
MANPPLSVVPGSDGAEVYNMNKGPETVAQRVQRLQAEAHMLALEEVQQFEACLRAAVEKAKEIAKGGDAYPAGIRDLAYRISEDLDSRNQTLHALVERTFRP